MYIRIPFYPEYEPIGFYSLKNFSLTSKLWWQGLHIWEIDPYGGYKEGASNWNVFTKVALVF